MNAWTRNYYHDSKGKILGAVVVIDDKYKASTEANGFVGWYISADHARIAVEESLFKEAILNTK